MKYLIVKCKEPREDEVDRTPWKVVEDWRTDFPNCPFEVWEIQADGSLVYITEVWVALMLE